MNMNQIFQMYSQRSTINTQHAPNVPPIPTWSDTLHPEIIGQIVTLTDSAMYKAGTKVRVTNAVLQDGLAQYDCEHVFKFKRKTCVSRFAARQQDILELQHLDSNDDSFSTTAKKRTSLRRRTNIRGRVTP